MFGEFAALPCYRGRLVFQSRSRLTSSGAISWSACLEYASCISTGGRRAGQEYKRPTMSKVVENIEQSKVDDVDPIIFKMEYDSRVHYTEEQIDMDIEYFRLFLVDVAKKCVGANDLKPVETIMDIPCTLSKPTPCVFRARGNYNGIQIDNKFMIVSTTLYVQAAQIERVWYETNDHDLHIIGAKKFHFPGSYFIKDDSVKKQKASNSDLRFGLLALRRAIYRLVKERPQPLDLLTIALNICESVRFIFIENRVVEATMEEYLGIYSDTQKQSNETSFYINNWQKIGAACHELKENFKATGEILWNCSANSINVEGEGSDKKEGEGSDGSDKKEGEGSDKKEGEGSDKKKEGREITMDMVINNVRVVKYQTKSSASL